MGTGALAAADLEDVMCKPHHRITEQTTHKLENNYTKKFSHCCESSRTHNRFPNLGISVRLRTPREFDFEGQWDLITDFHRTEGTDFWRPQTKPCVYQDLGESSSDLTRD